MKVIKLLMTKLGILYYNEFSQDNKGGFMTKKEMRKFAKKLRVEKDLKDISGKICNHIAELPEFQNAQNIMLYSPLAHEVDIFCLLGNAKTWLLPKVEDDIIVPYFYNVDDELLINKWQIKEPYLEERKAEFKDIDLVMVPALCGDRQGYRIGYGFGYYDKLLRSLPANCIKIMPLISDLVFDSVPKDLWDEPVDIIATEEGICRTKS